MEDSQRFAAAIPRMILITSLDCHNKIYIDSLFGKLK